ncbi:uncharacterized protein DS421_15g516060 [Arachis hypogaea]|nr:uncharacterized protein DS421_15g516060 [Arachis hypogaea]
MSNDKKAVVKELRFVAMTHIPALNVSHKLLKELAYSFDLNNSTLQTRPVDRILGPPWVQRWTRKKLVKRIESKVKDEMGLVRRAQLRDQSKDEKKGKRKEKKKQQKKQQKKKTAILHSSLESKSDFEYEFESKHDLEETPMRRKQLERMAKKMESEKKKSRVIVDLSSQTEAESNDE